MPRTLQRSCTLRIGQSPCAALQRRLSEAETTSAALSQQLAEAEQTQPSAQPAHLLLMAQQLVEMLQGTHTEPWTTSRRSLSPDEWPLSPALAPERRRSPPLFAPVDQLECTPAQRPPSPSNEALAALLDSGSSLRCTPLHAAPAAGSPETARTRVTNFLTPSGSKAQGAPEGALEALLLLACHLAEQLRLECDAAVDAAALAQCDAPAADDVALQRFLDDSKAEIEAAQADAADAHARLQQAEEALRSARRREIELQSDLTALQAEVHAAADRYEADYSDAAAAHCTELEVRGRGGQGSRKCKCWLLRYSACCRNPARACRRARARSRCVRPSCTLCDVVASRVK